MQRPPPEVRFWRQVRKTPHCWLWTGAPMPDGYGKIMVDGVRMLAHRYSYLLHNGSLPDGLEICHRCDNPACVRPDHLFVGTHTDNMRDAGRKGRMPGNNRLSRQIHGEKLASEIKRLRALQRSQQSIADELNVSQSQVSRVLRGECWS